MSRYSFETDIARHIWETKYRYVEGDDVVDSTVEHTWSRIAHALAGIEHHDHSGWARQFRDALADFRFLPGGRIQAGAGTTRRVTLFNCFVMGRIEDSMDAIFESLKEGALTMQAGGGVGYDFSTLRPASTYAHDTGNIASGPVSFMRIWDAMCATVLSTGARRGAMMATLRCDHPDVEHFVTAKQDAHELRHFNCSVLVTDAFMEAVERGDDWPLVFPAAQLPDDAGPTIMRAWPGSTAPVPCRVVRTVRAADLWHRIMRSTYDYAEPGVLFIDRINEENNLRYCEEINASNPCVTKDTWIHTDAGPRQVEQLIGRGFHARINGTTYASSPIGFFHTGTRPVLRVTTRAGHSLRLTGDHPVLRVARLTRRRITREWIKASDLQPGDQIALNDHRRCPTWPGRFGESEGYLVGHLIGDGTFSEGQARLPVWPLSAIVGDAPAVPTGVDGVMRYIEEAASELPRRADFSGWRLNKASGYYFMKLVAFTSLCADLDVVPGSKRISPAIEQCSSEFYRGFLRGLFDADGSVQGSQQKGVSIRLAQSDLAVLQAVQRMLLRLGIASKIYQFRRAAGVRWLPDGRGGFKRYACRANHELIIAGSNLPEYAATVGFEDIDKMLRLEHAISGYRRALNRECFVATVHEVVPDGVEDVFDVQIPGANAFDANGLYVHNCGEIPLPPYGACDLGSINLTRFVTRPFSNQAHLDLDGVTQLVPTALRMLDNVIEASRFPLPAQSEQARRSRRVGLGFTGLANVLAMLGVHYGSDEGRDLAARIMGTIRDVAYRASVQLAKEKGPFPLFEAQALLDMPGPGRLPDDLRDAIARHGLRNSHLTALAPTGTISLLAENVSSGIEPAYQMHYRRRVLTVDGTWAEHTLEDYAHRLWREEHGDAPRPDSLVTAPELSAHDHLLMQAAVQPYVDHAISKTINVPESLPFEEFEGIYREAYRMGLKGCTTFRPNPVTGSVLSEDEADNGRGLRCSIERECD